MVKTRSRLLSLEKHLELADRLIVGLIMTPRDQFTKVDSKALAREAKRLMELGSFDQLPVEDDAEIIGLVRNDDISSAYHEKCVGEYVNSSVPKIDEGGLISELLSLLESKACVLVHGEDGIVGLIHRSDLNKQAVRTYFYLWLAGAEMGLAEMVKGEYKSHEEWIGFLSQENQKEILSRHASARSYGMDTHLVEYADFSDLITVVKKDKDKKIWSQLGFSNKKEWKEVTSRLVELRNRIMHPVSTLVRGESDIRWLIDCDKSVRRLVEALHTSSKLEITSSHPAQNHSPRCCCRCPEQKCIIEQTLGEEHYHVVCGRVE